MQKKEEDKGLYYKKTVRVFHKRFLDSENPTAKEFSSVQTYILK